MTPFTHKLTENQKVAAANLYNLMTRAELFEMAKAIRADPANRATVESHTLFTPKAEAELAVIARAVRFHNQQVATATPADQRVQERAYAVRNHLPTTVTVRTGMFRFEAEAAYYPNGTAELRWFMVFNGNLTRFVTHTTKVDVLMATQKGQAFRVTAQS